MRLLFGLAAFALATLAAAPGPAALPPDVQRLNQLRAVLNHPELVEAFGPAMPITRIEYVGPNLYRVTAGRCHLDFTIIHQRMPRGRLGTPPFEARPLRRICGE